MRTSILRLCGSGCSEFGSYRLDAAIVLVWRLDWRRVCCVVARHKLDLRMKCAKKAATVPPYSRVAAPEFKVHYPVILFRNRYGQGIAHG